MASTAGQILSDSSAEIQIAAIETVAQLELTEATDGVYVLVQNGQTPDVRAAALSGLQTLGFTDIDQAIELALEDYEASVRMAAISLIPNLDIDDETAVALLSEAFQEESVAEKQSALLAFSDLDNEVSYRFLNDQISRMASGELPLAVHVELIETVESLSSEELKWNLESAMETGVSDNPATLYKASLRGGSAEQGARVFYNNAAAQCIRCHAVDGNGGEVGPELTSVAGTLSRVQLLESMVAPSARIAPGYGVITATLTDGDTVRGALREETDSYYVITVGSEDQTVQKSMIESVETTPSSMPAMGDLLSRRELRDLVEFMTTLNGPSGSASEQEPESH